MTIELLKKAAKQVAKMNKDEISTDWDDVCNYIDLIARQDAYINDLEQINQDLNLAVDMNMKLNVKKLEQALIATKGK